MTDQSGLTCVVTPQLDLPQLDSWPWSSVDVPGSPQLSRLFGALQIRDSFEIESLSLLEEPVLLAPETPQFVSGLELRDYPQAKDHGLEGHMSVWESQKFHHIDGAFVTSQVLEMKHHNADFFLPSGDPIPSPSPFNELYPFPRHEKSNTVPELSIAALKTRAVRLETYLATFGGHFSAKNPMMLQAMEKYANTLVEMRNNVKGAEWWKRIIILLDGAGKSQITRKISAMTQLLRCLGRIKDKVEAKDERDLHGQIWTAISQNLPAEHELTLEFLEKKAIELVTSCQFQEGEELYRQILQVRLEKLGPRHTDTIRSMSLLAGIVPCQVYSINLKKSAETGSPRQYTNDSMNSPQARSIQQLARTAVQLVTENGFPTDPSGQRIMRNQMALLREFGLYEEASRLGEVVTKRYAILLGEKHPFTINCNAELGSNYRHLGQFAKGEAIFRRLINLKREDDIPQNNLLWYSEELGEALRGLQRYEEAIVHLKKAFQIYFNYFGMLHDEALITCHDIGNCYIQIGRYESAREFYRQYIEKIRDAEDKDRVLLLLNRVQRWMEEMENI
jgi:tetratricopeptide (TPR) repeat protein